MLKDGDLARRITYLARAAGMRSSSPERRRIGP